MLPWRGRSEEQNEIVRLRLSKRGLVMWRSVKRTSRGKQPRQRPEAVLHKLVVEYLARALPKGAFFSTLPMSGGANFMRGPTLTSQGAKRGLPDILIVHAGSAYFIELKAKGGTLSTEQRATHADLQTARAPVGVCRSLDDVQRFLREDCGLQVYPWRISA